MIMFNHIKAAHLIAQASGCLFNEEVDQCICRVQPTRHGLNVLGGVIYTGYCPNASIRTHVASFDPQWMTKDLLWVLFNYPFVQLECRKIFAELRETNRQAIKFVTKLGFKQEARIEDVYPEAALVFAMYRDDCRWLKIRPSHEFIQHETDAARLANMSPAGTA